MNDEVLSKLYRQLLKIDIKEVNYTIKMGKIIIVISHREMNKWLFHELSLSSLIKEITTKITMRYHYPPIKVIKI